MIAQTDSSPVSDAPKATLLADYGPLTPAELYQLTLYKWRYSLEAFGFAADEVRSLMFVKWLYASQRLRP